MDKIKTVKIKNLDGSISEETYTISVDAKDVDMRNGKDLQDTVGDIDIDKNGSIAEQLKKYKNYDNDIKDLNDNIETLNKNVFDLQKNIEKKVYFFNTVADMKSANLKVGDCVKTLGFYEKNDGGKSDYIILNEEPATGYYITINDKYALLLNEKINVKQTGARGNGVEDDTIAIQNALNNSNDVYIPAGTYITTNTLTLKNKSKLTGSGNDTIISSNSDVVLTIDETQKCIYNRIENINFSGNSNNTCINLDRTTDNSITRLTIKNIYINNFNVGIIGGYMWNNVMETITFINTQINFQFNTQTNETKFINCTFSGNKNTTTSNSSYAVNCQALDFDCCTFQNNFYANFRQGSLINFNSCYFENVLNDYIFSTGSSNALDTPTYISITNCFGYRTTPLKIQVNNTENNNINIDSNYVNFYINSSSINIGNYNYINENNSKIYGLLNARNILTLEDPTRFTQSLINNEVVIENSASSFTYVKLIEPIKENELVRVYVRYAKGPGTKTPYLRFTDEEATEFTSFRLNETYDENLELKNGFVEFIATRELTQIQITQSMNNNLYFKYIFITSKGSNDFISSIDNTDLIVKEIPDFYNNIDTRAYNYSNGTTYYYNGSEWS